MRCAGLELIIGLVLQGGTPSLAEDKVVKFRNEMQQADRTALEARHAEINKAFEDWQLNSSSHEPERGLQSTILISSRFSSFLRCEIPMCADHGPVTWPKCAVAWASIGRLSSLTASTRSSLASTTPWSKYQHHLVWSQLIIQLLANVQRTPRKSSSFL